MSQKAYEALVSKEMVHRTIVDKLPVSEEGKNNLFNLMMLLTEIEEAHKNELDSLRNYVIIGDKILEGSPTQIGFENRQKVPAIFKIRLLKDTSDNFLAYCTGDISCVSEGTTRSEVLIIMKATIRRLLELQNKQVPHPIIMEVANSKTDGDTWLYARIKKSQARHEKLWVELKKARQDVDDWQAKVDNWGSSRLIDMEE